MTPALPILALLPALVLPPALAEWRAAIEAAGVPVLIAEVQSPPGGETLTLPEDTPGRPLFAYYLRQPGFLQQFVHMRGVMVHHQAPGAEAYLILLNGARRGEWERYEAALIGHELGHAWLRARRFPLPPTLPADPACLAIHAGDIVEHVLIRRELARRGIEQAPYWIESFEASLRHMKTLPDGEGLRLARLDPCRALRHAAAWVDARLGLGGGAWPALDEFESESRRLFPGLEQTAAALLELLGPARLEEPAGAEAALGAAASLLRAFAATLAPARGPALEPYANLMKDTSVALSWPVRARRAWPVPSCEAVSLVRSIP
jgi:hypothetical protein